MKMNTAINKTFSVLFLSCFLCACTFNSKNNVFEINELSETQYPFISEVKAYLEAGPEAVVDEFNYHQEKQAKDIILTWNKSDIEPDNYTLTYSTTRDYKNKTTVNLEKNQTSYPFRFLYKNTTYYVKLFGNRKDKKYEAETSFKTTSLGPRFLDVGGLYQNCRDLGGYEVGDKIVKYDMLIRGSYPTNLTTHGFEYLSIINTQLDLRGYNENISDTTSLLKNAKYIRKPCVAYNACFEEYQKDYYKEVFKVFFDRDNYPIYFHCAGGADRTGTVAALLLCLLGVDEGKIIQDYVVTSFSPVCYEQGTRNKDIIKNVLNGLNSFEGNSLKEKANSYFLYLGLEQSEINNIAAIVLE